MTGFLNIPKTIFCKRCCACGARPIIATVAVGEYVVKCSAHDHHYQTQPGLIDLDDWNRNNEVQPNFNREPEFALVLNTAAF
jgi:hypothetical protein